MNCNEVRPLLSAYYDGVVTPEERVQVESHLAHCDGCRHNLAEYRAIGADLRALPVPTPPVGLRRDVWRAIEAQQGHAGRRATGSAPATVLSLPQARKKQSFAAVFSNVGSSWSRALPAALLIGVMAIVLVVVLVRKDGSVAAAAALREQSPLVSYTQPIHILFNKRVLLTDAESHTTLWETDAKPAVSVPVSITVVNTGSASTPVLALMPKSARWQPGASYEVRVDAPHISLGVDGSQLDTQPLTLAFSAAAYTPTATSTPTNTPIPTSTSMPTDTPRPRNTAIAQITHESTPVVPVGVTSTVTSATPAKPAATATVPATATAVKASPTNAPAANSTPVPPTPTLAATDTIAPTATSVPTQTAEVPTHTPTPHIIPTATVTPTHIVAATPTHKVTPSATAVRSTPTPHIVVPPTAVPPCNIMPANGFGKIWESNSAVRNRAGCPTASETAIPLAAGERFQNGYMFWRGDTQTIYVFIGGPNDTVGTWASFPDTYQDGDPTVQPLATPPAGLYAPVRGFGKVYYNETIAGMSIQQALGWAIEPETNTTAAWQPYQNGYALWTADRVIRFMYSSDYLWMRFADTYIAPTTTPR